MEDVGPGSFLNDEPNTCHLENTYNFHEEVDQALNYDIEVDWHGADLNDPNDDQPMVSMSIILQTLGVSIGDAVAYAVKATKDRVPISAANTGPELQTHFLRSLWAWYNSSGFPWMPPRSEC